jgi:hypothetical protein
MFGANDLEIDTKRYLRCAGSYSHTNVRLGVKNGSQQQTLQPIVEQFKLQMLKIL